MLVDDPRSQLHSWITTILSVLVICFGFGYSALISTYKKQEQTFGRQDILDLLTLMSSLCWWVISTTVVSPSDGRSGSISTWLALFAISVAKHRRELRKENAYLFTTLLGGLLVIAIVAAAIMLASEDTSLTKPPSMRDFVGLILMVGPTIATAWYWGVAFVFQRVEDQGADDLETDIQGGVELAVRTGTPNPA
jgi:hypothetical protein